LRKINDLFVTSNKLTNIILACLQMVSVRMWPAGRQLDNDILSNKDYLGICKAIMHWFKKDFFLESRSCAVTIRGHIKNHVLRGRCSNCLTQAEVK
jgi:hypothetical protein